MAYPTTTFYKENDEIRRTMRLESLGRGLGMGGHMSVGMGTRLGMGMEVGPSMMTTAMKEELEEDPSQPCERTAPEPTLMNEPQFIFEFPGQDEENNANDNNILSHNASTHNKALEHESTSPVASDNFISMPPSFPLPFSDSDSLALDSLLRSAFNNSSAASMITGTALSPQLLDEHHLSIASTGPSLRPGSPTTESMRSMMSVFRVDPFASYDVDAGSRRKRRKRGSSYAMLSDPEQTSREEPLMFTFQIEGVPGSEYDLSYHHLSAGESSSVMFDGLSTPSPPSSPSINILPPGSEYYHQHPFQQDNPVLTEYNSFLQSAVDSEELSNMILATAGTSTPAGETNPISSRSTSAFSHIYTTYGTPITRQAPHQSFHSLDIMNSSGSNNHHTLASHHQSLHGANQYPASDMPMNPAPSPAYMLQNMRQSMGMNLGNLGNASVGMNINMGLGVASYQTATGPSNIHAMNIPVRIPVPTGETRLGESDIQSDGSNLADVSAVNAGIPPPMDRISVPAVSHLGDIVDHFRSQGGANEASWPTSSGSLPHSLPSHLSHSQSQSQSRSHHHHHNHPRYTQSQSRNQGFGNDPQTTLESLCGEDSEGEEFNLSSHFSLLRKLHKQQSVVVQQDVEPEYQNEPKEGQEQIESQDEGENDTHSDAAYPETENQNQGQAPDGLEFGPLSLPVSIDIEIGAGEVGNVGVGAGHDNKDEHKEDRDGNSQIRNLTTELACPSPPLQNNLEDEHTTEKGKCGQLEQAQESLEDYIASASDSGSDPDSETGLTSTPLSPTLRKENTNKERKSCGNETLDPFQNHLSSNEESFLPRSKHDVLNETSLDESSSSASTNIQIQTRASYPYPSTTVTATYRLNAAQFDLDLDSLSASEADFDVDMIGIDIGDYRPSPMAVGQHADYAAPHNEKDEEGSVSDSLTIPSLGLCLDSKGKTNSEKSDFPTPLTSALTECSTNVTTTPNSEVAESDSGSGDESARNPEPKPEPGQCRDGNIGSELGAIESDGTEIRTGMSNECFSAGMALPHLQPQSPIQPQAAYGSDDIMSTASCTSGSVLPTSQQVPYALRQIQSQSLPPYNPQVDTTPQGSTSGNFGGTSPCNVDGIGHIDYVHSKQYQAGAQNGDGLVVTPVSQTNLQSSTSSSNSSSTLSSSVSAGGSKMHICWICHKEFPRPSGLATHMNTHSGLKPYKCPIPTCPKTFAVRSNARRHFRIHRCQGANNPNLISETLKSNDVIPDDSNNLDIIADNHEYSYLSPTPESSGGPAHHSFDPSLFTSLAIPAVWKSLSLTPHMRLLSPSNDRSSTWSRCQEGNEEKWHTDSISNERASTNTDCRMSLSLRQRVTEPSIKNKENRLNIRSYPYPNLYLPPRHDNSGLRSLPKPCSNHFPLGFASLPSSIPFSSAYNYLSTRPSETYHDSKQEGKEALNGNEENKIEHSDFEKPRFEDSDHLQQGDISKTRGDNENQSLTTASDTSFTPTQCPTSTTSSISYGSISDMNTMPTLSAASTVFADSNMAIVIPRLLSPIMV